MDNVNFKPEQLVEFYVPKSGCLVSRVPNFLCQK